MALGAVLGVQAAAEARRVCKGGMVGADWGSGVARAGIVAAREGEKVGTDARDAAGGRHDRLGAEDSEVPLGPAQMGGERTDINSRRLHVVGMCVFTPCMDCLWLHRQQLVGVGKCCQQRAGFGRSRVAGCAASDKWAFKCRWH